MDGYRPDLLHMKLRPGCGICSERLQVLDVIFLLIGNVDQTTFSHCVGPYACPENGSATLTRHRTTICRKPRCSSCGIAREHPALHRDCFEFVARYSSHGRFLDTLWFVTTWQSPWRQGPYPEPEPVSPNRSMLYKLSPSKIKVMPPEILHLIHEYLSETLVWRYEAASQLLQQLPISSSTMLVSIPLREISSWTRGEEPVSRTCPADLPLLRLTADARGLRCLERLKEYPCFKAWHTDKLSFAVLSHTAIESVTAHFKDGLCRLDLPGDQGIQTWDTPTPPPVDRCGFLPRVVTQSTRFKTIDLYHTTGITLIFSDLSYVTMHAHTVDSPCAQATVDRLGLAKRTKELLVWLFVPISGDDYITSIALKFYQGHVYKHTIDSFTFGLQLGGDVSIGYCSPRRSLEHHVLSTSSPSTIILEDSDQPTGMIVGAYREEVDVAVPSSWPLDSPLPSTDGIPDLSYHSSAALFNVQRIGIFTENGSGLCRGMLLEYDNGASRSVGQCRLSVDEVSWCANPARLCICQWTVPQQNGMSKSLTFIESTPEGDHGHTKEGPGWTCQALAGTVEFWFSTTETLVRILDSL